MSKYTDSVKINKFIHISKLLNSIFIISKGIITQIVVPESVIIITSHRAPATMAKIDHNKSHLGKCNVLSAGNSKSVWNRLSLWSGINIGNNRILPCGIEIKRFVHHTIQVGHTVFSLDSNSLRHLPSGLKQL